MFPCFRVLIILYMNPWKSQVAQATLIHVCVENILHPKKCSLPDTLPTLQPRRRSDRPCVACLVSSADRCSASSVWAVVCPGTCPALVLARPVLLPVLCSPSGCAGDWGIHRRGIQGAPGVGWSIVSVEKIKKRRFFGVRAANTHPTFTNQNPSDCASLQKFQKIQKDPFRSLDCGIIS